MEPHRKTLERMVIRDFASVLQSKGDVQPIKISEFRLANEKIDIK
jgi:hypothetical protein